jgi:hypothetical protein
MDKVKQDLLAAVDSLLHQVSQMRGMFPDEDGTIQAAVDDAEEAAEAARTKATVTLTVSQLNKLVRQADKALKGDSNDAEHDALFSLREALAKARDGAVKTSRVNEEAKYFVLASEEYAEEGRIEFDDDAEVSLSEEGDAIRGAYVQAWVFVENPDYTEEGEQE